MRTHTPKYLSSNVMLKRQRGVVVVFALFAVVMLLIASVALVRSFDTSLTLAGNMAFKRDLVNQSERAVSKVISAVSTTGPLSATTVRESDSQSNNYSSTTLPSDLHGIPTILISDAAWATSGMAGGDISDSTSGITVRYVIDRLCATTGPSTNATCAISGLGQDKGGTVWIKRAGGNSLPVYRISIRVTGPRNTQTFVQSNISL